MQRRPLLCLAAQRLPTHGGHVTRCDVTRCDAPRCAVRRCRAEVPCGGGASSHPGKLAQLLFSRELQRRLGGRRSRATVVSARSASSPSLTPHPSPNDANANTNPLHPNPQSSPSRPAPAFALLQPSPWPWAGAPGARRDTRPLRWAVGGGPGPVPLRTRHRRRCHRRRKRRQGGGGRSAAVRCAGGRSGCAAAELRRLVGVGVIARPRG